MTYILLRIPSIRVALSGVAALLISAIMLSGQIALLSPLASAYTEETTVRRVGIQIEYPVAEQPANVAWESAGRAWFTSAAADMVGIITRNSSSEDELISVTIDYLAQENGSQPYDIVIANNTIWFTLLGSNQIARIDLAAASAASIPEATSYYPLPTANSGPSGIAVAPDGMVWVISAFSPALTRFDPTTETFAEWSYSDRLGGGTVSTERTYPDVATNHANQIWFTVPGADRMIGYDVGADEFSVFSTENPAFTAREPAGITVDNRPAANWDGGYPWVAARASYVVGRVAPGSLAGWGWYSTVTPDSGPHGIAFKDNGSTWDFWFTQQSAGGVGRLVFAPNQSTGSSYQKLSSLDYPLTDDSSPEGIAVGDDDTVWFAESGRRTVSEIRPPYIKLTRIPVIFGGTIDASAETVE